MEDYSLESLQKWLNSFLNFERLPKKNMFWLDTMEYLCKVFHEPQNSFSSVHVAGSKGKGSVSKMIASILQEASFVTGLYASPHIVDFSERVGTAGGPLEKSVYEAAFRELKKGIENLPSQDINQRPITWFELVTLFSFLAFRQKKADWGVFEVGLGGRLDATNVLIPKISVITPIELEHTEYLGDTLEKIAGEKAGIIKKHVPVVVADTKPSVRDVFAAKAAETESPIYFLQDYVEYCTFQFNQDYTMSVEFALPQFKRPIHTQLSLLGEFQAKNAALAALTVKLLFPDMDEALIEKGLASSTLPGRFEIISTDPLIVLDGAHTINSISVTLKTFSALCSQKPAVLFACAADKDMEHIAPLFKNIDNITLTIPGAEKQSAPETLQKSFTQAGLSYTFESDYVYAIKSSIEKAKKTKTPLLITGSFYLLAETKKLLSV